MNQKKRLYIVMDGRVWHDTDSASVLETITATSPEDALRQARKHWKDMDAVLCDEDYICLESV